MYFTLQRIAAFLFGLLLIGFGALFIKNGSEVITAIIAIVLFIAGTYVTIASLIPYKTTTEEVGSAVLEKVFIDIPLRFIGKLLSGLSDGL